MHACVSFPPDNIKKKTMPTYLCHGFRWHRESIRIFVIIHDLGDAAPDWVIGPRTSSEILSQLYENFDYLPEPPTTLESTTAARDDGNENVLTLPPPSRVPEAEDYVLGHTWSKVKLLEEYDPEDRINPSRPYAFVADYAVRVDLDVDVGREMAKYDKQQESQWFEKLRDQLQDGEEIRWYVVVCGDEEREVPGLEEDEDEDEEEMPLHGAVTPAKENELAEEEEERNVQHGHDKDRPASAVVVEDVQRNGPTSLKGKKSVTAGLRKLFGRRSAT